MRYLFAVMLFSYATVSVMVAVLFTNGWLFPFVSVLFVVESGSLNCWAQAVAERRGPKPQKVTIDELYEQLGGRPHAITEIDGEGGIVE